MTKNCQIIVPTGTVEDWLKILMAMAELIQQANDRRKENVYVGRT